VRRAFTQTAEPAPKPGVGCGPLISPSRNPHLAFPEIETTQEIDGGMSTITLANLVTHERIATGLRAVRKGQVLDDLARMAATGTGLDERAILAAVSARADLTTFGIGRGLALPHATVGGLQQPVGAFARLETPVDFGALDEMPADLVMLILAPEGEDSLLLRALACAARRLRDREVAAKLRGAANAEALHIVLTSDAWRGRGLVKDLKSAA
jgi:PTS system nitrogen regulatory IIA component